MSPSPAADPAADPAVDPAADPVVDWVAAAQVAGRLARPGPSATRADVDSVVTGLRSAATDAVDHVLAVTRLRPVHPGPDGRLLGAVHVVDRARWAHANTQVMQAMTAPVAEALGPESGVPTSAAGRLVGAAEVGALLAVLSTRVLGQFDPYAGPGRLLLVAPNVLTVERALDLDPDDFRLWVCLHEQTHALQFAAAPWLADHLQGRVGALLRDVTATSVGLARAPLRRKVATLGRAVVGIVSGAVRGEVSPLDVMLEPRQRRELEEITAVMALLEGHADVMMDAVGPGVVPSVATIRRRFERRRDGQGAPAFDVALRRLLGMDAKLAQYRDGAAFVRAVEQQVGRDGLNAVWASPGNLPSAREISDARAWVRRVHG